MIEKISLGPNIRRKIERMAPYVRDALFAEEARMSDELCRTYLEQGEIIDGFFARTGVITQEYFPLDRRIEILKDIRNEMDRSDYYFFRKNNLINPADFPLSIELDITLEEEGNRYLHISFFNRNSKIYERSKHCLNSLQPCENRYDDEDHYNRLFRHYWHVSGLQSSTDLSSAWVRQEVDAERKMVHSSGAIMVNYTCFCVDIKMPDSFNKDLFTFLAHLTPDRKNPFIQMLAHKNRPMMKAFEA